ncbi:MAG: phosphatidylglycerophosphatase A [Candidatus Acidiferrales bacterium]
MTEKTDPASPAAQAQSESASSSASAAKSQKKPRFALFVATAAGLGYLPVAPGTWGSLAGLILALVPFWAFFGVATAVVAAKRGNGSFYFVVSFRHWDAFLWMQIALTLLLAAVGVWSANRASEFWRQKDPQRVVIDEVSGQHLTLLIGCGVPLWRPVVEFPWKEVPLGVVTISSVLNWKYLLLGFILFRVFDIWKPFPARQAESLPGGWGIMADDWVAGIYAALGLWVARALGL